MTLSRKSVLVVIAVCALSCTGPLHGQSPATLHAMAEAESNPAKSVQLLCQAADLAPGNQSYRNDCNTSRASLLAGDQRLLKNAQDEFEAGYKPKAKRDARLVSTLDPALYKKAQDLIAAIDGGATPANAGTPNHTQETSAAQARNPGPGTVDPSVKTSANQIPPSVDHSVDAGAHRDGTKEVAANTPPSGDLRKRDLDLRAAPNQNQKGPRPPVVEVSPDEKKKRFLADAASALKGNDLDVAGRKFNQVLSLDPTNLEATNGLKQITSALNKDPAQLEAILRNAIVAYYASHFEDAESRFNRYLGADAGKRKGAAYFYLGATEATLAVLDDAPKRPRRSRQAIEDFKQAREAGYHPVESLVSSRVLGVWKSSGM